MTRVVDGIEAPVRRSRGRAPEPLWLPSPLPPTLAVGGHRAILSHLLGDLDHLEAWRAFGLDLALFEELFAVRPEQKGLEATAVQHHHALRASAMAENGLAGPVMGVKIDGAAVRMFPGTGNTRIVDLGVGDGLFFATAGIGAVPGRDSLPIAAARPGDAVRELTALFVNALRARGRERMPDLRFSVEGVEPLRHAASPHLAFRLAVEQAGEPADVRNVLLHVQIRLEPQQRSYDAAARDRLFELFGTAEQWGRTLHSRLWTHAQVVVPGFRERTAVELPVPCSFDFNIAATGYFDALEDGEAPVSLHFSGTVFYADSAGALRMAPIPGDREASCRVPVRIWKEMMELYYPRSAWLRVGKGIFDRLREARRRLGVATAEIALERLLDAAEKRIAP